MSCLFTGFGRFAVEKNPGTAIFLVKIFLWEFSNS